MKNLKILRTNRQLSQKDLANILHVSQQSIYKYENGISAPDIATLMNMADYFHTSIDYLVGYTNISHRNKPVTKSYLNDTELEELRQFRRLSDRNQKLILRIMQELTEKE